jgi:hypothetical protein
MTKMTKDELIAALRALDRKGMIESFIDADGEVCWRITAKGRVVRRAIRDGDAAWQEDSRYGLDS